MSEYVDLFLHKAFMFSNTRSHESAHEGERGAADAAPSSGDAVEPLRGLADDGRLRRSLINMSKKGRRRSRSVVSSFNFALSEVSSIILMW